MIEIAKIVKPQGIKGEVKALPFSNVEKLFDVLTECLVGNKVMHIEHISFRQGFLYIKFKEINTRNDAELLRNQSLKIEKSLLEEMKDEDEFLVDDLIGMVLYDDKGAMIGQIVDILNYGASDIIVFEKDNRQFEVPYVDSVFKVIDGNLVVDSEKLLEVMIW